MKPEAHADLTQPAARYHLTWQGWCMLGLVAPLGATLFMPAWQPQPYAAALAIGLLLALVLAWWKAPRSLHGISGEWVLPRSAHALAITTASARLSTTHVTPPLVLLAWQPTERKMGVAARLIGLAAQSSRKVPASRLSWSTRFPRRGLQWLPPLSVSTSQPFGLVSSTFPIGPECEFLVFPALGQIRRAFEIELQRWMESHPLLTDPGNDELAQLRPYRPGDHPHSVHWKASARRGSLHVMERHAAGSRRLALVVDTASGAKVWKFERLISVAATLVDYFCAKGWSLSLYGLFAPEGIHGARAGMLEALALAQMQSGHIRALIPEQEATIVLSLHPLTDTPPHSLILTLAECEQLVALPPRVH
ncbi:DUF58 domain-containing protein [Verrucomicrobiota bacterium sgz303538]